MPDILTKNIVFFKSEYGFRHKISENTRFLWAACWFKVILYLYVQETIIHHKSKIITVFVTLEYLTSTIILSTLGYYMSMKWF